MGRELSMTAEDPAPVGREDFPAYVRKYGPALMATALIMLGGRRADAEDLVAETFQNLWKQWQKDPDTVRNGDIGYALTALRNTATSQARFRGRRPMEVQWDSGLETVPGRVDIEDAYLFGEFQKELWAAVGTLEQVRQDLINLIYVQEYTVAAAGRQLGLTRSTADRYHRFALKDLKKILSGLEEEQQVG